MVVGLSVKKRIIRHYKLKATYLIYFTFTHNDRDHGKSQFLDVEKAKNRNCKTTAPGRC